MLIIEDIDALASLAKGDAMSAIGSRLLAVARKYPGRLFVICTGSPTSPARMDADRRWLGQFSAHQIDFDNLGDEDLRNIFSRLLTTQNLSLASNADTALKNKIKELRGEAGDDFDNAYAMHRLADGVLQNRATRLQSNPQPPPSERNIIVAEDIRNVASIV